MGNITYFFWILSNFLGKSMCTLKCGIFPNNWWGQFHKILVIYLFTKFFGNIPYFFWNLSIFGGKFPNLLGKSIFTLKCEIFPNNCWGNFAKFLRWFRHIFLGNIPIKLEILQNIWGIFHKNWASSKIIMETSTTFFGEFSWIFGKYYPKLGLFLNILGIFTKKLGIFQNIWGIFPRNWESSKTIMETSTTYFWGIFAKNWEFS